jgi:hypothetical protein
METVSEIRELVENMKCMVATNHSRDAVVREVAEYILISHPNTTSYERQQILENTLELIYNN